MLSLCLQTLPIWLSWELDTPGVSTFLIVLTFYFGSGGLKSHSRSRTAGKTSLDLPNKKQDCPLNLLIWPREFWDVASWCLYGDSEWKEAHRSPVHLQTASSPRSKKDHWGHFVGLLRWQVFETRGAGDCTRAGVDSFSQRVPTKQKSHKRYYLHTFCLITWGSILRSSVVQSASARRKGFNLFKDCPGPPLHLVQGEAAVPLRHAFILPSLSDLPLVSTQTWRRCICCFADVEKIICALDVR